MLKHLYFYIFVSVLHQKSSMSQSCSIPQTHMQHLPCRVDSALDLRTRHEHPRILHKRSSDFRAEGRGVVSTWNEKGRADVRVHTSWDTSTKGKCPRLTCIMPIFPKEFWMLINIRLQNIQKFSGRQHEICIENLFRFLPRAQLTL